MRAKISKDGLLIPKMWFEDIDEVDIQKEQDNVITITPVREDDPIFEIGKNPIIIDVNDASINHDTYLYGQR